MSALPALSEPQRDALIEGLRIALAEAGEHRLFRGGKLDGLFPSRTGGEIATFALGHGLLETVRTETRGKSAVEWVRLTPAGVEFVHDQDSPRAILRELNRAVGATREGIPEWLDGFERELGEFGRRIAARLDEVNQRLDLIAERVERALRRAEAEPPDLPERTARMVPWGVDALVYLDRRAESGAGPCALPELFAALERDRPDLGITEFQDGLRRLAELRAVTLCESEPDQVVLPEFAMIHDGRMVYHLRR